MGVKEQTEEMLFFNKKNKKKRKKNKIFLYYEGNCFSKLGVCLSRAYGERKRQVVLSTYLAQTLDESKWHDVFPILSSGIILHTDLRAWSLDEKRYKCL